MQRVKIVREFPPDRSFREAEVELLADDYPPETETLRLALHTKLLETFQRLLPNLKDADELFSQLSLENVTLGTLTDVISYALDLGLPLKQKLLSEPCVDRRATLLISHLDRTKCELVRSRRPCISAGFQRELKRQANNRGLSPWRGHS